MKIMENKYCNGCGVVAEFVQYHQEESVVCSYCGSTEEEGNKITMVIIKKEEVMR